MPIPRATARLQLHRHFDFDAAADTVDYHAALGISHLYASPIFTAQPGSTHGYDVVDPTCINPELGGEDGLRRLVARLHEHGMGLILDIVPNHMGIAGANNAWWQDVLEWGRDSAYATWFDIDWQREDDALHGKVLLPFLGAQYGRVLQDGELELCFDAGIGKLYVGYPGNRFPINVRAYSTILRQSASPALEAVIAAFDTAQVTSPAACAPLFAMLTQAATVPDAQAAISEAVAAYAVARPGGAAALHALLEDQHYRLAWWRYAADGLNWRRFFEVTELAGLRVENIDVFDATHALVLRLYAQGLIDGVRVDHVDGLADPTAYCLRLRQALAERVAQRPQGDDGPAYVVVEKILAAGERLRRDWLVDGTTGYDFMDQVGAFLHAPQGEAVLDLAWAEVRPDAMPFSQEVQAARRQLLVHNLASEHDAASRALLALARSDLATRDYSFNAIRRVFAELLVQFPVYRTYVSGGSRSAEDQAAFDLAMERAEINVGVADLELLHALDAWLGGAAHVARATPSGAFGEFADSSNSAASVTRDIAVTSPVTGEAAAQRARLGARAIRRFQQLTPPLVAKSVEDTAFYRYGRLLSRNQVGSDPGQFALSSAAFHAACKLRAETHPHAMLATATHDHKRGEDVTARLAVLSEVPEQWRACLQRWRVMNAGKRVRLPDQPGRTASGAAPDPADESVLYQTLVGAWPIGLQADDATGITALRKRVAAWQQKALREAKTNTSWVEPDTSYEQACNDFLHAILDPGTDHPFIAELIAWVRQITCAGIVNSLTQTVLRLTAPGVPDLYQGADLWDFSLVDPDNRRPVDFTARAAALATGPTLPKGESSDANVAPDAWPGRAHARGQAGSPGGWQDGTIKQHIIGATLGFRKLQPALFADGEYLPLAVIGARSDAVFAFLRRHGTICAVVIVACRAAHLVAGNPTPRIDPLQWGETMVVLPAEVAHVWRNVFTGARLTAGIDGIAVADALSSMTVAVLAADL